MTGQIPPLYPVSANFSLERVVKNMRLPIATSPVISFKGKLIMITKEAFSKYNSNGYHFQCPKNFYVIHSFTYLYLFIHFSKMY